MSTYENSKKSLTKEITMNGNMKKATIMLALDLEKAFDHLWQDGLIQKLPKQKVRIGLVKLISSYLVDRTFIVKVQIKISATQSVKTVSLGTRLAPSCFFTTSMIYPNKKIRNWHYSRMILQRTLTFTYVSRYLSEITRYFDR